MTDYRDEYVPDPPPRNRKPKFWDEGLYESAYEDEEGGDSDA